MQAEVRDLYDIIEENYPGAGLDEDEVMLVPTEGLTFAFVDLPNDPASILIRVKILSLGDLKRPGDFAKAVLAGNLFYQGGRGAALSVGQDNALYLTGLRMIEDLLDKDAIAACIGDFAKAASDWKARGALYA